MTTRCKRLTIFEGVDGSGKSTAAKQYAAESNARYVHFPALPRVTKGLGRMYVEAMLPALLGYQDVVFDRSWYSEVPYGAIYREGGDRLGAASRRMLERLAMRCSAMVVLCRPSLDVVLESYRARRGQELLRSEEQVRVVYDIYRHLYIGLPTVEHDYLGPTEQRLPEVTRLLDLRVQGHPVEVGTAGNWQADIIIVGDSFGERKDSDAFYQWPFASFSGLGCSRWLTEQLATAGVPERSLLWVNADQVTNHAAAELRWETKHIFALGDEASKRLQELQVSHVPVAHPQHHKRFNHGRLYPLVELIVELTHPNQNQFFLYDRSRAGDL